MKLKYTKHTRDRVFDVIRSCENADQLIGAYKYCILFMKLYEIEAQSEVAKRIQSFYNLKRLQLKFDREN
mgnify:CR=1 FL=1